MNRWGVPADEHAYWLAARRLIEGQPLYDPTVTIITPYAYLYPPPLAQALVPVAAVVPSWLFSVGWIVLMGVALWWLAGRDVVRALALVAFLPVAVEFWFRNVHLFLAVLVVLGLRRWAGAFAVGAAIKIAPGLGIPYLALRGRWRPAAASALVGLGILAVSVVLSPDAWAQYVDFLRPVDPGSSRRSSRSRSRSGRSRPLSSSSSPRASTNGAATSSWSWPSRSPCRRCGSRG